MVSKSSEGKRYIIAPHILASIIIAKTMVRVIGFHTPFRQAFFCLLSSAQMLMWKRKGIIPTTPYQKINK